MSMIIPDKLTVINQISDEGNFGEVILCENTFLANRKEAVKFIKIDGEEEEARILEIKNSLFECSVLEYLKKCKYIVEIYDAEILEAGFRINMEYLEKGSVQNLLNEKSFLDTKQILKISECTLHALEYAHFKGIFHLDIKPGNILIKNETIYKLSDFGLANIRGEDGNSAFKRIYTMHVPPEVISAEQIIATEQSDIYMFGVTLYRLLNGDSHLAKQRDNLVEKNLLNEGVVSGKFPDRSHYMPHVNKKIIKVVNKCMNVDLEKRYKNVREARIELAKIKFRYHWLPKNITARLYCWECLLDNIPCLEIVGEKTESGLWNLLLMKYGKTKKTKISKHCAVKLTEREFYNKARNIFQEYF